MTKKYFNTQKCFVAFKIKLPNFVLRERKAESYSVLKFGANKPR